jgi:hypothetical protein
MGGSDFFWEDIEKTVNSQIQAAEQSGEGDDVLAELKELRERLNVLQKTGTVPEHPAQAYDQAVRAAISRLLPGAEVVRQEQRSREIADFVLRYQGSELFIETKWRSDPARQFGGSTLQALVPRLPPRARLLVVVNAPPMPRAYTIVREALGERGRIVMWRDVGDDNALGEALISLLGTATKSASQAE